MSNWVRAFLQCREMECRFVFTTIGQENFDVQSCPACGETSIDYAYKNDRTKFAKALYEELKEMEAEGEME